ncbi:glutamine--tRNA ligase [Buchnera aphidicola]|uniref:glutamine--tRNA ligase n=1 Tax=Buchnera aphidicola TaxID=9 RepID=UPI003464480C
MNNHKKKRDISFIHKIINKDLKKKYEKNIHTRFPPDPNGYLHLGHAKSLYINFEIAKHYQGKCNLRFDDTNPNKKNSKYIKSIKQDILWLGYKWNKHVKYASMYFKKIYKYAVELIKKNLAYVDKLKKTDIRTFRGTLNKPGINSPYRNQTIEENMTLFENMKYGNIQEGMACLRAKIDMKSPIIIMRDPVLYRIKFNEHHKTNHQWCIYPTYDFAHCISDAIEGITHSLCTLEFQDNRVLYKWILDNLNILKQPQQYEYSRLNIEHMILSKRKLGLLIKKKIINNWDDPRMPTISGLRRRGYTANSILNFCKNLGITKQDNLIEMSSLESCIRKELDSTSYRTMGILDPITISITNINEEYEESIQILNHPKNHSMGFRKIIFNNMIYIDRSDFQENPKKNYYRLKIGGTVKLKYSYTITANSIEKDCDNNITKIFCTCNFQKNHNKDHGIIHWISKKQAKKCELRIYSYIFNDKNPNIKKNFLSNINNESKIIYNGFINKEIQKSSPVNTYQLERIGYFKIDNQISTNKNIILHQIVSLKENKKNK